MKSVIAYIHGFLTVALAALFIYAGTNKFIPKERPMNQEATKTYVEAIETGVYENPVPFRLSVKMLKGTGFLYVVGALQLLAGVLMVMPHTRLFGLVILLPITINIFLMHAFMDNDIAENIQTGLFMGLNFILIALYYQKIKMLFSAKIKI